MLYRIHTLQNGTERFLSMALHRYTSARECYHPPSSRRSWLSDTQLRVKRLNVQYPKCAWHTFWPASILLVKNVPSSVRHTVFCYATFRFSSLPSVALSRLFGGT